MHLERGEVLERLKRHAWKACIPLKGIAGSNPALSAVNEVVYITTSFFYSYLIYFHVSFAYSNRIDLRKTRKKGAKAEGGASGDSRKGFQRVVGASDLNKFIHNRIIMNQIAFRKSILFEYNFTVVILVAIAKMCIFRNIVSLFVHFLLLTQIL